MSNPEPTVGAAFRCYFVIPFAIVTAALTALAWWVIRRVFSRKWEYAE